jgi:hypothetical protein
LLAATLIKQPIAHLPWSRVFCVRLKLGTSLGGLIEPQVLRASAFIGHLAYLDAEAGRRVKIYRVHAPSVEFGEQAGRDKLQLV